jgi:uncharacterized protein
VIARPDSGEAGRTAITLAISAGGGLLAEFLGLPAGWIAGGLLAVTLASLAGVNTQIAPILQAPIFLVLGIYAGSGVTHDTLHQMRTWPASFAILGVSVVVLVWSGYWLLHKRCGWARNDALLATVPGALAFVVAAAEGLKADMKKVAISQSMRVLLLIELIPLIALLIGHPTEIVGAYDIGPASLRDLAILIAAGIAASAVCNALKLPGGWIIGGLVSTAALLLGGVVEGRLPPAVTIPGSIGLAAIAGCRFRPGDLAILPRIAGPAFAAFAMALAISAVGAACVTLIFDISFLQTLLAFGPGAQEALTVLAFQMNVDPAYVAAHHVVRFLALVVAVPVLARWLARKP